MIVIHKIHGLCEEMYIYLVTLITDLQQNNTFFRHNIMFNNQVKDLKNANN
jgi:hypothetical protein